MQIKLGQLSQFWKGTDVLQDLAKIGVVKPGKLKFASRYADPSVAHIGRDATSHLRNRKTYLVKPDTLTLSFSLATVNATGAVCTFWHRETAFFSQAAISTQFVSLEPTTDQQQRSLPELTQPACHPSRSAILEMRPAHTQLEDMAREEMSEFDLDYPW